MSAKTQIAKLYRALKAGQRLTTRDIYRISGSFYWSRRRPELEAKYGVKVKTAKKRINGRNLRVVFL